MGYKQLRSFNKATVGQGGYCLKYVRECFSIPAKYDWAKTAWDKAQRRHETGTLPNVNVPVFFTYASGNNAYGHVVVWCHEERVFYSSPSSYAKDGVNGYTLVKNSSGKQIAIKFESIDRIVRFYGSTCTYLGWTEDINTCDVVISDGRRDETMMLKCVKGTLKSKTKYPTRATKNGTYNKSTYFLDIGDEVKISDMQVSGKDVVCKISIPEVLAGRWFVYDSNYFK